MAIGNETAMHNRSATRGPTKEGDLVRRTTHAVNALSGPQRRRIIELDGRIRRLTYPNCATFARDWQEEKGERLSAKTVQRDFDWLKAAGAPLEYDYAHKGYRYSPSRDWTLPFLDVTEAELVHVLLARQMAEQLHGTGLADTLARLFERMTLLLPEKVAVDPLVLRQKVTFHSAPARTMVPEVWTGLLHALRSGVAIRIEHRAAWRNETFSHEIEPVHLACVEDEWYLLAWSTKNDRMTHFAVPRIQSVELTDRPCELREFDPEAYVSNRFGRWIGDSDEENVTVVLRFDASVAPYVKERPIHYRQTLKSNRDGSVTVSFPAPEAALDKTVLSEVLRWGSEVRVVRPKSLRGLVAKKAHEVWAAQRPG